MLSVCFSNVFKGLRHLAYPIKGFLLRIPESFNRVNSNSDKKISRIKTSITPRRIYPSLNLANLNSDYFGLSEASHSFMITYLSLKIKIAFNRIDFSR